MRPQETTIAEALRDVGSNRIAGDLASEIKQDLQAAINLDLQAELEKQDYRKEVFFNY